MDELKEALQSTADNKRITCEEAQKIAEELQVEFLKVGKAANELGIKIVKCQLGCF